MRARSTRLTVGLALAFATAAACTSADSGMHAGEDPDPGYPRRRAQAVEGTEPVVDACAPVTPTTVASSADATALATDMDASTSDAGAVNLQDAGDASDAASGAACTPSTMHPCPTMLALGDTHTCALFSDGTTRCWGKFNDGQLGIASLDGGTANSIVDLPTPVVGLTDATSIAAGTKHTCAATASGGVSCWGNDVYGQLGIGSSAASLVPVSVVSADGDAGAFALARAVSLGQSHTCVTTSAATYCWGRNNTAQLGLGAITPAIALRPTAVASGSFVAIAAGGSFTCALDASGNVSCFGDNSRGAVGQSDALATRTFPTPTPVRGLAHVAQIAAGQGHACAVLESGALLCWGDNALNQLAAKVDDAGAVAPWLDTPTLVALPAPAQQVTAGGKHTCALVAGGDVYCWGDNSFFQRGTSNSTPPIEPTRVETVAHAVEVRAGSGHTCARMRDGTVACWGRNSTGQVGHVIDPMTTTLAPQVSDATVVVTP